MTHPDRTAVGLVVDRSGSMSSIKNEAQGAINSFISDQAKLPGEVLWTIALFDHEYAQVALNDVQPGQVTLEPRGTTALLDAVGRTIDDMGKAFSLMDEAERPSKVVLAIVTDGFENSSQDYTGTRVRQMIEEQREKWQWEIIFLAAGLSRAETHSIADDLGVARAQTMTVNRSAAGMAAGAQSVSAYVADYRTTGKRGAKLDQRSDTDE